MTEKITRLSWKRLQQLYYHSSSSTTRIWLNLTLPTLLSQVTGEKPGTCSPPEDRKPEGGGGGRRGGSRGWRWGGCCDGSTGQSSGRWLTDHWWGEVSGLIYYRLWNTCSCFNVDENGPTVFTRCFLLKGSMTYYSLLEEHDGGNMLPRLPCLTLLYLCFSSRLAGTFVGF